ncbi:hypothetical protein [Pimelobacter simplex]|uniref:hypothetical protein n=1 Tax=Nocardioides simplex TaxID=2045 RepID=UPI00214FDEFD|nr:hypothetical protein [Pimelobacter simplex]UUW88366.1 hypothetical protein M0M43_21840 [Pimelobacter simplex]UUW97870.1 hypothetical protein M0M48_10485 [Pimelobacter simplex]
MNPIPKVSVAPHDGGWSTSCPAPGCGFVFWHIRRDVADAQAITHQQDHVKKGGRA